MTADQAFEYLLDKLEIDQLDGRVLLDCGWVSKVHAMSLMRHSIEHLQQQYAVAQAEQQKRAEIRAEQARIEHEAEICIMLKHGAKDRAQALRWMKQAS